jgi:hypothetical protein
MRFFSFFVANTFQIQPFRKGMAIQAEICMHAFACIYIGRDFFHRATNIISPITYIFHTYINYFF